MKRLYIRWYVNGNQSLPYSENFICSNDCNPKELRSYLDLLSDDIVAWLLRHPNGKVDYVWV